MTIAELIQKLSKLPNQQALVLLSIDEEGNGYSPVVDVTIGMCTEEYEIKLEKLTPKLKHEGYTQEDVGDPAQGDKPCIVLWP